MTRIKSDCVAWIIVFSLIFTLPLFGCSENVVVRKPVTVASAEVTKQTIKNEDPLIKEDDEADAPKKENKFFKKQAFQKREACFVFLPEPIIT